MELLQLTASELITPRFRALEDHHVEEKNPGDLVTIADREAELRITAVLQREFPRAVIVGEEACATHPDLETAPLTADHSFTIDPVDGTKNFVHGRPDYAVMVAEMRAGTAVHSWIWHPEHQVAWEAERGSGVTRNGEPVAPVHRDPEAVRVVTSSPDREGQMRGYWLGATKWSCGIDYPRLLEGHWDASIYRNGKPWDHAPGALMLTELGGAVLDADGQVYRIGHRYDAGLVAAATTEIARSVTADLQAVLRG